jgi:hypothetical protein
MMDHDDIRAALELAAVEPGGLDRLAAGDTGEAAALAGHLAGCAGCMDELTRLRRADMLLRPLLASTPAPELRARTLAYVRALGRDRGAPAAAAPMPASAAAPTPAFRAVAASAPASPDAAASPDVAPAPRIMAASSRPVRRAAAWPAAVAAALVIGLAGGFLVAGGRGAPAADAAAVAFTEVSRESAALLAAPDVAQVVLSDAAGVARGSVIVAPSAGRMVAIALDLPDPGAGREYRCWVEVAGSRKLLWTMSLTGSVAWWTGPAALPASLVQGARFGVSLVTVGSGEPGQPVLTGGI